MEKQAGQCADARCHGLSSSPTLVDRPPQSGTQAVADPIRPSSESAGRSSAGSARGGSLLLLVGSHQQTWRADACLWQILVLPLRCLDVMQMGHVYSSMFVDHSPCHIIRYTTNKKKIFTIIVFPGRRSHPESRNPKAGHCSLFSHRRSRQEWQESFGHAAQHNLCEHCGRCQPGTHHPSGPEESQGPLRRG